jgi:cytochrome c oxidase subunit IV
MAEHHQGPRYGSIWVWLAVLTVVEVLVAAYITEELTKIILLIGLALTKAALVALYFMHLRFERGILMLIAFTPLIICSFLVFMLLPDLGAVAHKSEIRSEQTGGQSGGH